MLKAPRGRISLKNIWVIIRQNIRAASYVILGMLKMVQKRCTKRLCPNGHGGREATRHTTLWDPALSPVNTAKLSHDHYYYPKLRAHAYYTICEAIETE